MGADQCRAQEQVGSEVKDLEAVDRVIIDESTLDHFSGTFVTRLTLLHTLLMLEAYRLSS